MSDELKSCKKHGDLSLDNFYIKNNLTRCRLCQREWSKNNYLRNKKRIGKRHSAYTIEYRKNNPDKVKEYNKRYWEKGVEELKSNFIKDTLSRNSVLKISEIPNELVDLYRPVLKLKRKLKELKDDGNS